MEEERERLKNELWFKGVHDPLKLKLGYAKRRQVFDLEVDKYFIALFKELQKCVDLND